MGVKLNKGINNVQNDITVLPDDRFNWRYQDKAFNESFKRWRKNNNGTLGFYHLSNPKELIYKDKSGFVKEYPEAAETSVLRNAYSLIGQSLLLTSVIDIIYLFIAPGFLSRLGFNISFDFYNDSVYGNEWLLTVMFVLWSLIRRLCPFILSIARLKMPVSVMLPVKASNRPMLRYAAPVMLLVCPVCLVFTGLFNELLFSMHIRTLPALFMPEKPVLLMLSLLMYVIIIPVLCETLSRGVFLQLLRQFGDGSAIVLTSFITAVVSYNLKSFCFLFILNLVIGYFAIRSGSIITAVIMRSTSNAFICALYLIRFYINPEHMILPLLLFFFICLVTGLVFTVRFMIRYSDKIGMSLKNRYLLFSRKLMMLITSIPVVLWFTVSFIITLVRTGIII